jgi:predicted transcriptional regulator
MNVNVPDDLCEAIAAVAKRNRISPEEAIRQAIQWFVKEDEEFWKDFRAGERASAEALALVERLAEQEGPQ